MDHVDILKEATRTISSPRRFVKGKYVTDRGGCSIGHLVVAANGGVTSVLSAGTCAAAARDAKNPELMLAIDYVAKAMHGMLAKDSVEMPDDKASLVVAFNDAEATTHNLVVKAFKQATEKAEADMEPEAPSVEEFDMGEVDSLLAEYAEKEEQLVAA